MVVLNLWDNLYIKLFPEHEEYVKKDRNEILEKILNGGFECYEWE